MTFTNYHNTIEDGVVNLYKQIQDMLEFLKVTPLLSKEEKMDLFRRMVGLHKKHQMKMEVKFDPLEYGSIIPESQLSLLDEMTKELYPEEENGRETKAISQLNG